jgi:cubilin
MLYDDFGEITSPGYPQPYEHDSQCNWEIIVGVGEHISLNFLDIDLEDNYRPR